MRRECDVSTTWRFPTMKQKMSRRYFIFASSFFSLKKMRRACFHICSKLQKNNNNNKNTLHVVVGNSLREAPGSRPVCTRRLHSERLLVSNKWTKSFIKTCPLVNPQNGHNPPVVYLFLQTCRKLSSNILAKVGPKTFSQTLKQPHTKTCIETWLSFSLFVSNLDRMRMNVE